MKNLPAELLLTIFTSACTDGGQTSCALSLVSKHIREVSRPLRFYSVALSGSPRKLQLLVSRLQEERVALGPCGTAPRVRHLFIVTAGMEERMNELTALDPPSSPEQPLIWTKYNNHAKAAHSHLCQPIRMEDRDHSLSLVDTLVRIVAADLETLTFLQGEEDLPADVTFPRLRELTVIDGARRLIDSADGTGSHPLFPVVRRLHLIVEAPWVQLEHGGDPGRAMMDLSKWTKHAPRVSHLRISELASPYMDPIKTVYVGDPSSGLTDAGRLPFKYLQQVVIQPEAPPSLGWCGTPLMNYLRFVTSLWRSQAQAAVPLYIVPPAKGRGPVSKRWTQQAREEWGAQVEGRPGDWEDPSEEYAHLSQQGNSPPTYLTPWK
ncbi:hypothetical protein TRAPUB_3033 [Trametes pubescens]|uniref:Uncharacterized protein n=1 Tax=Trametes pubescens TaxID=154538 RepID=A0A1M2VEX5_TRAPU|nr:hypothetical protein TRAPUB_3033 [Trametes pubescens]